MTVTQGFVATAPLVSSVVRGSGVDQVSGELTWDITFNQPVTGVLASHFTIVSTSNAIRNITPTISGSGNTYTLTLTGIPAVGIDAPTDVSLRSFVFCDCDSGCRGSHLFQ